MAAANGARRSLPMASTACVSPSASLRLPLPHACQDIFTDTRSACLSGFQGSMPLPAQTAKCGSLKACPERSRTDPQDLGMDRLAEAFPYGCATPIRHPQSSVALRFEAATHMPRYSHTHGPRLGESFPAFGSLWSFVSQKGLREPKDEKAAFYAVTWPTKGDSSRRRSIICGILSIVKSTSSSVL